MTTEEEIHNQVISQSEHEDTEEEVEENPASNLPVEHTLNGNIIPDPTPDVIDADADLAAEFEDESQVIELVHLKIRSMEDLNLSRFKELKSLILRQNLLDSINEIKNVNDDIEEFDVYDNRIKHISSHLNTKTKLKSLDLSFNKIRNIKNIENLTQLTDLFFVQNKITDIVNLDNFTNLKNLELGGNRINEIKGLDNLKNLTQLWLGKNKIRKLENLSNLTNLKILSIQSNRITKLEGLDKLINLEELYISHNGITKIEGLENNLKLNTIDITSNQITNLENLSHLTKLTDLWASYNRFDDFNEVEKELKELPELDTVYFEGNPLQLHNVTSYRRKLIILLPQLSKIDATYIK